MKDERFIGVLAVMLITALVFIGCVPGSIVANPAPKDIVGTWYDTGSVFKVESDCVYTYTDSTDPSRSGSNTVAFYGTRIDIPASGITGSYFYKVESNKGVKVLILTPTSSGGTPYVFSSNP